MTQNLKVRCPLCEGHGEILQSELTEKFTTPALRQQLDQRLAGILNAVELVSAHGGQPDTRDFEKEVHSWNPQLPMWRRSPKE